MESPIAMGRSPILRLEITQFAVKTVAQSVLLNTFLAAPGQSGWVSECHGPYRSRWSGLPPFSERPVTFAVVIPHWPCNHRANFSAALYCAARPVMSEYVRPFKRPFACPPGRMST